MPTPRNDKEPADDHVARAAPAPAPALERDGTRLLDAGLGGRRQSMRRAPLAEAVVT